MAFKFTLKGFSFSTAHHCLSVAFHTVAPFRAYTNDCGKIWMIGPFAYIYTY